MRTGGQIAVPSRLMQERILAGVTRAQMAAALGIAPRILRDYEAGETRIAALDLANACRLLGLRLSHLFYENFRSPNLGDAEDRRMLVSVPRPPTVLDDAGFARIHSILRHWREQRGQLSAETYRVMASTGLFGRMILARKLPRTSRLVVDHFGPGIRINLPCEALLSVGRDMYDHYPSDPEYGAWTTRAYEHGAWTRDIGVELIRATVHTSSGPLRTRYDRIVLPWSRGTDDFVMALSLRRELPTLAPSDEPLKMAS